ncbi:MAG: hypothetical protein V1775_14745 [Bacteroidota bacterium]
MGKYFLLFLFLLQIHTIQGQNRNISNGLIFDGEPYLSVNPSNPHHLVVAWMGFVFQNRVMIRTRVSYDGGNTWSQTVSVPHVSTGFTSADPSMAFDSNGNVFLSYVDYDPGFTEGAVYLRKSADGGLSWGNPVTVIEIDADPSQQPVDRPWISIDRTDSGQEGNIYITTVNASGAQLPPFHPYFIRSTDNGATFGPWRYADTTGWLAGSLVRKPMPTPAVSSDGTFHCIYPSYVVQQSFLPQFIIATSENAGASFTYNTVCSSGTSVAVADTSAKKGYLLKADPSDPDHLAFIHLSNENGDADVFLRESYDAGESWSDGTRINDDPSGNDRMQDLVWAGFDTDGDLAITWRDRRNAADTGYAASYEIFCATRYKDSPDFSPNFRISDNSIPFDDVLMGNGNDFMCVELYNDTLNVVWGDTREGNLSIWFQRVTMNGILVSVRQLAGEKLPEAGIVQISPNTIEVTADNIKRIHIYNTAGILISETGDIGNTNSAILNVRGIVEGLYVFRIETMNGILRYKYFIR